MAIALVDSATGSTFRRVSGEVEKYTAGVLSASTVHGLLQRVSQDAIDKEKSDGVLKEREGKTAEKSRNYVLNRLEKGADWREKAVEYEIRKDFQIPEGARGLGAIEGNEAHLFADRMKDRGMSWTIAGAQHMDVG